MNIRVFCDFDGTVIPEDVGDRFFEQFAPRAFAGARVAYLENRISSSELFEAYARELTLRDEDELRRFCAEFEPVPDFGAFVGWARERGMQPCIVSDGLDAYITEILGRHKIDLPVLANHLRRAAAGAAGWRIERPWSDPECDRCGCCKRNRLMTGSPDDAMAVLIGDGMSDFCVAAYADMVFACGGLETHCREHNITFRAFRTFCDVQQVLETMLESRRSRISRQARVLRNAVWIRG